MGTEMQKPTRSEQDMWPTRSPDPMTLTMHTADLIPSHVTTPNQVRVCRTSHIMVSRHIGHLTCVFFFRIRFQDELRKMIVWTAHETGHPQNLRHNRNQRALLGAACPTCHDLCREPSLSHLRRGAAQHVDPSITDVGVSLPAGKPKMVMSFTLNVSPEIDAGHDRVMKLQKKTVRLPGSLGRCTTPSRSINIQTCRRLELDRTRGRPVAQR